jgi:hypothetical protein
MAAAAAPDSGWSRPSNGLQARLSFKKTDGANGTPYVVTYLELQNVSDVANVFEVPLKIESIAFELRDETGKVVPPTNGSFDGTSVDLGMLRLPHDSTLRFNIASRGAGVPKDQAALLDLGPSYNWTFARGDRHSYSLSAKFTIAKTPNRVWSGTIKIPATPLPPGG